MLATPLIIPTKRFILRSLDEGDVTIRYVSWFCEQVVQQYISAATASPDIAALRQFVVERSERDDVVFLGIFEKKNGLHIGNIKYEPVDSAAGYAIGGILIGDPHWRGMGVAAEVLLESANWLHKHRNIRQIVLGVDRANTAAINAYRKVGFIEESTAFIPTVLPGCMTMVWHLT